MTSLRNGHAINKTEEKQKNTSCSFVVLVNGSPPEFFSASRGLCRGSPSPPFCFVSHGDFHWDD